MLKHSLTLFAILGMLIAVFGIGVDYRLPGASPGFNLPRLFIVAAGLTLSFAAVQLRREKFRRRNSAARSKGIAVAVIIALLTLFALEIVLTLWGMPTYHPTGLPSESIVVSPWWTCDEAGCHYVYDAVGLACESGELRGRVCAVNRQGYSDSEDFVVTDDFADKTRILLLGDSFTYGMSADTGMSFADMLNSELSSSIIWNTGTPGTGTNQALASFKVYGSLLRPQLTILGFVNNDFSDNLLPIDSWLNAVDSDGQAVILRKYLIDNWENVTESDLRDLRYYRQVGKLPPGNEFERLLGMTRLGTLLLRLVDAVKATRIQDLRYERRFEVTRQYLLELRDTIAAGGSEFLVLLIPRSEDIGSPTVWYQMALQLMQELNIAYLDPVSILDPVADYAVVPDTHWNNAGHQKAGALLSDCIERFIASGNFSGCEYVTAPSQSR